MKNKSVLFLLILILNLFILGNSSSILANPEAINDTKTDPTGDANKAFVDIINATVSKNENYFIFSVFTQERIPTNTFTTAGGSSEDYEANFTLLMNSKIFFVGLHWLSQPWVADVKQFDPNTNQTGSAIWTGYSPNIDHIGNQLSVQVPTSILGNSNEYEWFVSTVYRYWVNFNSHQSLSEKDSDICPDNGVPWWEEPIMPAGHEDQEDPIMSFLGIPIFGLPWGAWLIIIVVTLFILYTVYLNLKGRLY